ncbi:hypothetical protein HN873_039376, partial [Arachis hypogaea]
QIVAVFGVDCASGDTFTDGSVKYTMTSMNVPKPTQRVGRYIEPLLAGSPTKFEFVNLLVGQAIPSGFIPAIEKGGFNGHPVENLRVVLIDGAAHTVDSNELAFKLASIYAFRQCYTASRPVILEPVMLVELKVPTEFQGAVAGDINKRKGVIVGNDQEGDDSIITAHFVNFNSYSFPLVLWLLIQYKLLILLTLLWPDKKAYNETLLKLAGLFQRNLETFTNHKIGKDNKLTEEILAARPVF